MPDPVPYRGRAKWVEVLVNLVLAAVGGLLTWILFAQVPAQVLPMRAVAVYTGFAAVVTAVLAAAMSMTTQLPTLESSRSGSHDGVEVRAWPGDWWHGNLLDLGLVLLAGTVGVMGLRAGETWLVLGLLVATVGAWFMVRVVLSLSGSRCNEALRLTPDEVVHESAWGTVRCSRRSIHQVRATGQSLTLVLAEQPDLRPCPRPWRGRRRGRPKSISVDCSMMGHDAADLAAWLRVELLSQESRG